MGALQTVGNQFGLIFGKLSAGHRLMLVLLGLVCAGSLVAVAFWAATPEYEMLCTDMSAKDCAAVLAALKDAGIRGRVTAGGTAVMVPAGKVERARMAAAEKGIPGTSAAGGFEAFREPKIGMTPFAERINYISALQQELAATIMSLDAVAYARVHLAVPERSLFKDDAKKPTASVLLVAQAGRQLSASQVQAVANLVASAVEGMAPEDVTVTDGRGGVLAGRGERDMEMAADDQFLYRQRVENYLSDKAETMLAKVLGYGRCEVRVSAELEFQDVRETSRQYDDDKKALVSERIESTESTGSVVAVGGLVGAAANVPGQQQTGATAAEPGAQQSTTENIDTQYMVSESVREMVNRGATIKRLTVAALVDLSPPPSEGEESTETAAAIPTLEDITRVIQDAIGIDESRGDSLRIVQARFRPAAEELTGLKAKRLPQWAVTAGEYFAIGVVGLILLFVVRRVFRGIHGAAPQQAIVPEIMATGAGGGVPARTSQDELVRREIARFVEANPDEATRLLEGWVEGEE